MKTRRVIRTEAHRVQESIKLDAAAHADKKGVKMCKTWNSLKDERVRPGRDIGKKDSKRGADHRMLDGKKIPVEDDFIGVLGKGKAPGQLGHPTEDINCWCFLTYTVEKIENADAKKLEKMAFEEWKKEMDKESERGKIAPTVPSGAIKDPKRQQKHADTYYEFIRKRKDDVPKIAKNVGWKVKAITEIKEHVFMKEHLLQGEMQRFYPDYEQAQAWQRLRILSRVI